MLLAKIKEKLFNRRNKVEIEDVEVKGDIPASIKALIESLGGTKLYKHVISFETLGEEIILISNQSSPYSLEELNDIRPSIDFISGFETMNGEIIIRIDYNQNDGVLVSTTDSGNLSFGTDGVDTVTPL